MRDEWWRDNDQLLAALHQALRAADEVPPEFVAAGKAVYTWHTIDAELADLTYDSSRDQPVPARSARTVTESAEIASLLALTFTASDLTIELEISGDALLGQIVPPCPGQVELHLAGGRAGVTPIDDVGCFLVRPIPAAAFRLLCRPDTGRGVLTTWITV